MLCNSYFILNVLVISLKNKHRNWEFFFAGARQQIKKATCESQGQVLSSYTKMNL